MSYHYLLDLALILLSTKLLGIATGKFQMPRVVGALLAGLILGPAVLNILTETAFLSQLSELGVIVILFTAGMGTDLRELRSAGKAGFLVALCGVLVPIWLDGGEAGLAAGQHPAGKHFPGYCTDRHLCEHHGRDPQGAGPLGYPCRQYDPGRRPH